MFNYSINYKERKQEVIDLTKCSNFNLIKSCIACRKCSNYFQCVLLSDKLQTNKPLLVSYNSSLRVEKNGIELITYKKRKAIQIKSEDLGNVAKVDTSRMFAKDNEGNYVPCKDCFTYESFYRSIKNSRKRSFQTFFNFALANDWEYFFTLTVSPELLNRFDDIEVKNAWSKFEKEVKRLNPDARILAVPEYHKAKNEEGKKALHFHGFMANVPNLTWVPCIDKYGEPMYSNFEVDGKKIPRLQLKDWKYGFSTADLIVERNNLRIANYCTKYMWKGEDEIGYNKKRYFRTKNLDCCYVDNLDIPEEDLQEVVQHNNLEVVKETDNFIVYRTRKEGV